MQHDEFQLAVMSRTDRAKNGGDQVKIICPSCSADRTRPNQSEPCMSVRIYHDRLVYQCWHCDITGAFRTVPQAMPAPVRKRSAAVPDRPMLTPNGLGYLQYRGIAESVAKMGGVFSAQKRFRKAGQAEAVGFPYTNGDGSRAVKYRTVGDPKDYTQDGAAQNLYMVDRVQPGDGDMVVVEGEVDALSCWMAGVQAVSVPAGAPMKVKDGKIDPSMDKAFGYIRENIDLIKSKDRVILAVDRDGPGQALAEEIARRIGKASCWMATFPDDCKDANDVLMKHGSTVLHDLLTKQVEPWPVAGLYSAQHYLSEVLTLYDKGHGQGASTGLPALDQIYTVAPGLTVVTGHPGSGKSELIDAIMINLATHADWKFAIASFENPQPEHITKILEKHIGTPFFDGPSPRMGRTAVTGAMQWVSDHFAFLAQEDGRPATMDSILERATSAVQRLGIRGLVIDPYNYIERDRDATETDAVSQMLTKAALWARAHEAKVWFVAHPQKMYRQDGGNVPIPKGYDISGSAAWFAKADEGLTVHRLPDDTVEVHSWKCRHKWIGQVGVAALAYDRRNGRYSDPNNWTQAANALSGAVNITPPSGLGDVPMPWED
jgi:twinkle protein|tara:strand:+ start:354 stop:2159 length:1806 start_codon:yes stop_codon:yes gene_type:complete